MSSVHGVPPVSLVPTYQQAATTTLVQLTQAAKQGDWRKIAALIATAKTIQEQLLTEIYNPSTASNREQLLEIVRNLEVEILAHEDFLSEKFGEKFKRPSVP